MRLTVLLTLWMGWAAAAHAVGYDAEVAVVVGVSKYAPKRSNLPNAVVDAKLFAHAMKARGATVIERYDAKATEDGIIEALDDGLAKAKGGNKLFVFYFAGHGNDGGGGHILPYGARSKADHIALTTLKGYAALNNKVRHQVFILGSCKSGLVFRNDAEDYYANMVEGTVGSWFGAWMKRRVRLGLTAGSEKEDVYDGRGTRGSRFGIAVAAAISKPTRMRYQTADGNRDGCVDWNELGRYVQREGGHNGFNHPMPFPLPGSEAGFVAFCQKGVRQSAPGQRPEGPRRDDLGEAGIEWVAIEGGTFQMGSNYCCGDERPVHRVRVPSFELAKTEVTVGQYRACVAAGKCTEPDAGYSCNWFEPGRDDHPVNCVTWTQARAFSNWVGGRLPTEAEWEFAARSRGQNQRYPWGDAAVDCDRAILGHAGGCTDEKPCGCGRDSTWPVCSKPSGNSAQGVCDLAGNLQEWVEDVSRGDYSKAPKDGSAYTKFAPVQGIPSMASDGTPYILPVRRHVVRGGSWASWARNLRAAYRNGKQPHHAQSTVGFRPARARR